MKHRLYFITAIILISGCQKYLDEKSDQKLQLPNTIDYVQGLLDNEVTLTNNNPGTGEACADNYYVTDASWASLTSEAQRNMYTWQPDITLLEYPNHWSRVYDIVTISNVALESINLITPSSAEQQQWNNVKGSALLHRARSFLTCLGLWAKAYDVSSAVTDPGIPLRLNSDYQIATTRSSVQDCYNQIISDLKESAALLPIFPQHPMRPSRAAAYAFLARAYLNMSMFDSANVYADKCLSISSSLLNYNNLTSTATYPIPVFNSEVIMHILMSTPTILSNTRAKVDSSLYKSYTTNDLRKTVFFKSNGDGSYAFKGSYNQNATLFIGLTTDEMFLIKAETLARKGDVNAAMAALNSLLITRWKTGTFVPFTASNVSAALGIILTERRKELAFRDLRWTDLKRLNKESAWQQTILRKLNGKDFSLQPGDNRYALPIPNSVIEKSGIAQNPR